MPADPSQVDSLREALAHSPDNVPLRQLLAETLLQLARHDEAEQEFRAALARAPRQKRLQVGLAQAFFAAGKFDECAVLVESLLKSVDPPPRAHVLDARLKARRGDAGARAAYERAVAADPALRDPSFESELPAAAAPRKAPPRRVPLTGEDPGPGASTDDEDDDEDEGDGGDAPGEGRRAAATEHDAEERAWQVERPDTTFADVGGMDELKDEIRMKILLPLEQPELFAAYGKKSGGGILLFGPPGCGKTHLARATAGEAKCGFLAVGIHEVLEMWVGQSEKKLHSLFEQARRRAPCILFFDEVDALGASRADLRQSALRTTINQFLAELDGMQGKNEGVLVLAATNAPWQIDPAFRRPGRFDRVLFVPPPDDAARAAVVRVLLRGKPAGDVDAELVAKKTKGWSCADLRGIVDTAVESKLRDALKGGARKPITTDDLLAATKRRQPTTGEWLQTARNYAVYANEGGQYDDVLRYLGLE
ncbi:MAG TPA: AAA family ATPase [Planctomycetota bacterium]|nr:AAA family ATPase [Planctomycetota bacterium]